MKQASQEAFENNMHHRATMKVINKVYLSNQECSVQEVVYHVLPELKLRIIFPAAYFVNANWVWVLLSEKELSELPDDNPNMFKKSNIDWHMERPSATFCHRKYSISYNFCYAEFLAYFSLENNSSNTCDYHPDKLDDNLIENNREEYS